MKPFAIRNIEINPPLVLSPMASVTDFTFRRLIKRRGGVGLFSLVFLAGLLFSFAAENAFAQKDNNLPPRQTPVLKKRPEKKSSNQIDFVRGCGENEAFWICGRVIDANGKPVAGIDVEVTSAYYEKDSPLYYSAVGSTDENGYFKGLHYNAKFGAYVISIRHLSKPNDDYPFPTTFYPDAKIKNEAKVFVLGSDTLFEPIIFQLPPRLVKQKISLTFYYEDGSPAEEVSALLENTQHHNYYENHGWIMDENGFVEMDVFADNGYQIKVNAKRLIDGKEIEYYGESSIFELSGKMIDLKLILKKTN